MTNGCWHTDRQTDRQIHIMQQSIIWFMYGQNNLDTKVVLKDENSNVFETLMVFTDSGISLKCQFNGANEVAVPVDENIGSFG